MSSQKKREPFSDSLIKRNGEIPVSNTTSKDKKFTWETIKRRVCKCSTCEILYSDLSDQLKCTQENIQRCKEDTNKILSKVEKLEAILQ